MIEGIQFPAISIDICFEINYYRGKSALLSPMITYYENGRYRDLMIIDNSSHIFVVKTSKIVQNKMSFLSYISKTIYSHKIMIEIIDMTCEYGEICEIKAMIISALRRDSFWLAGGDVKKRMRDVESSSTINSLIELFKDLDL